MGNGTEMVRAQQGIARQELTATELDTTRDATAQALAVQARAEVEARIIAARRWPRDIDAVRVQLLAACRRPRFADAALYGKPVAGKVITGLSARFAEEAARAMGNLHTGTLVLAEDTDRRMVRVYALDLEANFARDEIVAVPKFVERSVLRAGQVAIRSRTNSSGKVVHVVEATDDEIMQMQGALTSKAWRNLVLKMVPADIREECEDVIRSTRASEDRSDPEAARKRIADAFAAIGVKPAALRRVMGCELAACSPAQIETLRGYYAAIKGGDTTWAEIEAQAESIVPTEPLPTAAAKADAAAPPAADAGAEQEQAFVRAIKSAADRPTLDDVKSRIRRHYRDAKVPQSIRDASEARANALESEAAAPAAVEPGRETGEEG